jgi:cytochrome c oxidase subunit 3
MVTGAEPQAQRLSIELCTVYWHFLLIVWLVMFAVLANT